MIHAPLRPPKDGYFSLRFPLPLRSMGKNSPCFNFCSSCSTCSSLWNGHTWAPLLKHINMNHQLCHYVPHPSHAIHEMGLQREAYNVKVVDGCATVLVKLVIFGLQTVNICPSSRNRFCQQLWTLNGQSNEPSSTELVSPNSTFSWSLRLAMWSPSGSRIPNIIILYVVYYTPLT